MTTKTVKWITDAYGNSVRLVGTADADGVRSNVKQDAAPRSSYAAELAAYRRDKEINILMRQRHGVNM